MVPETDLDELFARDNVNGEYIERVRHKKTLLGIKLQTMFNKVYIT